MPLHISLQTTHLEKSSRESFDCNLCPSTFTRKHNLQRHIRITHGKQRKYPCSYCGKKWANSQGLQRHVEAMHPKGNELQACEKCEYKTHAKYNLEQHVRAKHTANSSAAGSLANFTV